MKWVFFLLHLVPLALCQSATPKSQAMLTELKDMASAAKCNAQSQEEWNHAIAVRQAKRKKQLGLSADQCFTNLGDDVAGPSGNSGSFTSSKELRGLIADIFRFKAFGVKSFFDAACGDFVFMQHVNMTNIDYIGADISDVTVAENNRCFAKENIHFVQYDLTCHTPPSADLMLMRDVLFHFKDEMVIQMLKTVMSSKVKYLLTTTFLTSNQEHEWKRNRAYSETDRERGSDSTIGFREINLMDKPFCLPPPILQIQDSVGVFKSTQPPRYVGLWKLPVPVGQCPP